MELGADYKSRILQAKMSGAYVKLSLSNAVDRTWVKNEISRSSGDSAIFELSAIGTQSEFCSRSFTALAQFAKETTALNAVEDCK
jgi:hypothetical protein